MEESTELKLDIVTPEGKVVDSAVTYVSAPGFEGEFGVLPGHADFLATLKPGEIKYEDDEGEHYLAVSWGYAEVKSSSVIILADNAELAENIDLDRAKKDLENWNKKVSESNPDDESLPQFEAKLQRAKARVDVATRLSKPI